MIRFKEQSKRVLSDLCRNSNYYHLTPESKVELIASFIEDHSYLDFIIKALEEL